FGSSTTFAPVLPNPALGPPSNLMGLDTTLPPMAAPFSLSLGANAIATGASHDGRLLAAVAGGNLFLIDTGAADPSPMSAALPAGEQARDVVFSPDDATIAVATDHGVGVVPVALFGTPITTAPVNEVQRIAFSPDGTQVLVLSGPSWSQVDCKAAAVSQVFSITVAAPGQANPF